MKLDNIPLNFTLEEAITYVPELQVLSCRLETFYDNNELFEEADSNKHQLLENILDIINQPGNKVMLVKKIKSAFDDSMVEM
jgi:hypothetical protein